MAANSSPMFRNPEASRSFSPASVRWAGAAAARARSESEHSPAHRHGGVLFVASVAEFLTPQSQNEKCARANALGSYSLENLLIPYKSNARIRAVNRHSQRPLRSFLLTP